MSHLISVEIDNKLAQRLVEDPQNWTFEDKDELLQAIEEALAVDDAEEEDDPAGS